jgi:hypothetical protein
VGIDAADSSAQTFQNTQTEGDIRDLGDIFNAANPVHQKGGGDNGHSSVFGTADLYFTKERLAAANYILRQCRNLTIYHDKRIRIKKARCSGTAGIHPVFPEWYLLYRKLPFIGNQPLAEARMRLRIFEKKHSKKMWQATQI